jgi:hypothetical protein
MNTRTYTNKTRRETQQKIGLAAFLATHRYLGSVTKRALSGKTYTHHTYEVRA